MTRKQALRALKNAGFSRKLSRTLLQTAAERGQGRAFSLLVSYSPGGDQYDVRGY